MLKDDLIVYLQGQLSERNEKLADYDNAVVEKEVAELTYKQACAKVDGFGNIEDIKNDRDKINGFIIGLTTEETARDEEAEEVAEETTDTIINQ